jgi:NADPH:quinone reductase-like Zn-dependent oxidoreductase
LRTSVISANVGAGGSGPVPVENLPLAPPIQAGTLAEYALMPADSVAAKPAGLDFVSADERLDLAGS